MNTGQLLTVQNGSDRILLGNPKERLTTTRCWESQKHAGGDVCNPVMFWASSRREFCVFARAEQIHASARRSPATKRT